MRTTLELPDTLFRELKSVAAQRGTTLKNVIRAAIEVEMQKAQGKETHRVKFPILSSKNPGSLNLTNAEIDDLLA